MYIPTYTGLPPAIAFELKLVCKRLCAGWPKDLIDFLVFEYVIPAVCTYRLVKAGFVLLASFRLPPLLVALRTQRRPPRVCNVCGATGKLLCGRCGARRYCGPACQKADWFSHGPACAPQSQSRLPTNINKQ